MTKKELQEKYGYAPEDDEQWIVWRDRLIVVHPSSPPRVYHISRDGLPYCKVMTI